MNKKLGSMWLLGFCLLWFASCHKTKTTKSTVPVVELKKDTCNNRNFKYNELKFKYFNAKGKLSYQDQNNSINANVHLRISKDSLIWISVSQLGIEGARFIINKDSIFGVDKIHNTRYAYSIDHFSKQFNIALSYKVFESVLVGNLCVEPICSDTILNYGDYEILKRVNSENTIETYTNGQNLRVEKFTVVQKPLSNSLNVSYSDFKAITNILFGHKLNASIKYLTSDNRVVYNSVYVEYNKVDIDEKELKFPFKK